MDQLKRARLDELVENLGMTLELRPLLDSDEAYLRLEKAVSESLRKYERKNLGYKTTKIGVVKEKPGGWRTISGKRINNWLLHKEDVRYEQIGDKTFGEITYVRIVPKKGVDPFRRYFGIECEPHSYQKIATINYKPIFRQDKNKPRPSRLRYVRSLVTEIIEVLREREKTNIWYGTL